MLAVFHGEAVGQEPALTDIPHMAMHPQGYQAMITDDDDWLQDFATAQLQANSSPASVHNGPEAEQAGTPGMSDNSISHSTASQLGGETKKSLDASVLHSDLQVKNLYMTLCIHCCVLTRANRRRVVRQCAHDCDSHAVPCATRSEPIYLYWDPKI